jgi:hypothetical protein
VRRQNAKLVEEKERIQKDLDGAQAQIRELRERLAVIEEQLQDSEAQREQLRQQLAEALEDKEAQRIRADDAERLNVKLEETLAAKEAEVARLRQALEEQLQLTKEVCEAAERSSGEARAAAESAEEISKLHEKVKRLETEKGDLEKERQRQDCEFAELQKRTVAAMAAAEKAMAMHAAHVHRVEQLRIAKLAEAIQHKVELHISVPRVTLSCNNAPPLLVSVASGLGDNRIKDFLDCEVFAHFEPLWVTLDALDKAPDGTSKKAYSSRMLERLTEAVKGFVEKSQRSESEGGLTPSVRESLCQSGSEANPRSGAQGGSDVRGIGSFDFRRDASPSVGCEEVAPARRSNGDAASPPGPQQGGGGSRCAMDSLAEVDRERLLCLLRAGDDRGLDAKLQEVLQRGA